MFLLAGIIKKRTHTRGLCVLNSELRVVCEKKLGKLQGRRLPLGLLSPHCFSTPWTLALCPFFYEKWCSGLSYNTLQPSWCERNLFKMYLYSYDVWKLWISNSDPQNNTLVFHTEAETAREGQLINRHLADLMEKLIWCYL